MTGDYGSNSFSLREENPSFDQSRREVAQPASEEGALELVQVSGRIKWFDVAKGFGFIVPDDGSKDLFVHHSEIQGHGFKSLAEGAKVSYVAQAGPKGPNATQVSPV